MKTLTFTKQDITPILNAPEEIGKEVMLAVAKYCFNGEEPEFEDDFCAYVFNMVLPTFRAKRNMSRGGSAHKNAGNNHASKEGKNQDEKQSLNKGISKPNQSLIKGQSKVQKNDSKKIGSTDTCEAQKSKPNQSLPFFDDDSKKETEKEEKENASLPSVLPHTPTLTSNSLKEKKEKDKEKKELLSKNDEEKDELAEREKEFNKGMQENYPRVCKMRKPLTYAQYRKMIYEDKMDADLIKETLESMENSISLTAKYESANLTIRNWYRIRLRKSNY